MITKQDWADLEKRKARARVNGASIIDPVQETQAAAVIGQLVSDPAWAYFQRLLAEKVAEMHARRAQLVESLVTGPEAAWAQYRRGVSLAEGWLEALSWAMGLPQQIKERGEFAAEELSKRAEND